MAHFVQLLRYLPVFFNNNAPRLQGSFQIILLPLQYLIKHAAFQEEQECRMLYITQWSNDKIHNEYEYGQMYLEYQEPVSSHIQKIYLSPGAAEKQDAFKVLLKGKEAANKICISGNPFRHKG